MTLAYIIKFLAVMLSMLLADACWTLYFMTVSEKKAIQAGLWSSAIILFGALCTTEYVHDRSLIIAAMLGAFLGSTFTVLHKKNQKQD